MPNRKGFVSIVTVISAIVVISLFTIVIKSQQVEKSINAPIPSPKLETKEATQTALPQAATVDNLQKYLTVQAAFLGVSDNISLYFKDLKTPHEVSIDPVRSWIPASTIKSYVILEAFRQRRLGIIDFDDQITILASNVVPTELETDAFPKLREGTVATIGQLVGAMIDQSDNTAYNTILDVLDRRNINGTLRNLGLTETVVGQKLNLDDNQTVQDSLVPGYQLNTTTAKDLASFFNILYDKKVPDSDEMLNIFKNQKINNMIPAFLPANTPVAHKTGDWAPIYHDGGIVYKQNNPFVLSIFTNGNDPAIIAKLAEVAYFQNASVIGKPQALITPRSYLARNKTSNSVETLAKAFSPQVLAASDQESNFPNITAADLGITALDLNPEKAAAIKIGSAIFTPGTIFYDIKRYIEDTRLRLSQNNNQRIATTLDISKNRLSEVKTTAQRGDIQTAKVLIGESESAMKKSIDISTNGKPNDADLLRIKQVSDLHFATLAEVADKVPAAQKEAFIDMAYNFYTQNQKEIKPVIQKSLVKASTQQEPIIGTVAKVSGDTVTVKFEDGSQKDVVTNSSVPSRQFNSAKVETQNAPKEGTRIAIVGQTTAAGKIIPTFILRDIPKIFPDKKTGTVIRVDPDKSTLQIQDSSGKTQEVKVGDDTVVKSKDTNVSIEGIKPGSQVTVFGTPTKGGTQNSTSQNGSNSTKPAPSNQTKGPSINANTVTVTKNSPSKSEQKKEEKKNESKPEPPKSDNKSNKK